MRSLPAAVTAPFECAHADLVDDDIATHVAIGPHHTAAFLFACARASLSLRMQSFHSVIAAVRRRKAAHAQRGFDCTRDRELVAVFNRLRPLVFSSRHTDSFSSLALIEFLALHGSFPSWVWGVTRQPDATHNWVQREGWVFNGPVEYVLRFTPLFAV